MQGIIIKNISNTYTVSSNGKLYECKPTGKLRFNKITPVVGDYVEFIEQDCYIKDILPRKNVLNRPDIANVDIALIITSVKEPNLDLLLLDKLLCNVIKEHITPVICFTKIDLISEAEKALVDLLINYYNKIGIVALTNQNIDKIKEVLSKKTVVLTGQTGAGKSSLINRLDAQFDLKTSPISKALGRGIHTTRNTEMYPVSDFFIADTPGFSSIDLTNVDPNIIKDTFIEFKKVSCRYRDCMHNHEEPCAVKDLVNEGTILKSRYDNYLKIISDNNYKKY
ncbi:MAG: ribosome small subunit-dependent GTPase A [Bacilli bacterium]|nr:ribosome small subunit-dependent GTPase A [Bacilli bacterium]